MLSIVQDREPISESPPPPPKASLDLLDVAAPWYAPLCDKYRYPKRNLYFLQMVGSADANEWVVQFKESNGKMWVDV